MSAHNEWTLSKDAHGQWMVDRGDDERGVTVTASVSGTTLDIDVDGTLVVNAIPVSVILDLLRAAGVLS